MPQIRAEVLGQLAFLAVAAGWTGLHMHRGDGFGLLEGVILYSHEGGHLILSWMPRFIHIAAGTGAQILLPLVFVASAYVQGQRYASGIASFWLAASLAGSAGYCQDAIDQEKPLLFSGKSAAEELEEYGETEHDFVNMLDMLHLPLRAAHPIALLIYLAAMGAWAWGVWTALEGCGIKLPYRSDVVAEAVGARVLAVLDRLPGRKA